MRTIMYARGPGLRKGFRSEPLMMTDHYNLICHLLDINAQPNNGSWLRVEALTVDQTQPRLRRNFSPELHFSITCSLLITIVHIILKAN